MNALEAIYHHLYRQRKREAEARRVQFPDVHIVSVGNLTTGGTGKTPAVQWIVRRLQNENIKTVVVGRGYGGEYSARGAVVSDGDHVLLSAAQAGDEALLHARALPKIPVVIGRDRVAAVKLAIETFAPQVVVLDDGFQYWSLSRDFDLVLLDARRPFGNLKLLPIGRLREPAEEARRANAVLLTRADAVTSQKLEQSQKNVRFFTDAPLFISNHAPVALRDERTGAHLELELLRSQRVAALAALANNETFFQSLHTSGAEIGSTLPRRDHHRWREKEVRTFAAKARQSGAQMIVTTEKDAVKIQPDWCLPLPLFSLQIELKFADSQSENALWKLVNSHLV